jgi:transcriptional regulator with GAF, ATPase, and Fis domain/tetratricopeptide (TPR) repeat protein
VSSAPEGLLTAAQAAKAHGDIARACGLVGQALTLYNHQAAAADGSRGLILRGRLHHLAVTLDLRRERLDSAERAARTALVLFEEAGDTRRQAMAWEDLGSVAIVRHQPDLAIQLLGRALDLFEQPKKRARVRLNLALAHQQKGHYLAADTELRHAAAIFKELGCTRDQILALLNAAVGHSALDDRAGLATILQTIRDLGAVSHHPELHTRYLMFRGVEASLAGDPSRAARLLRKALYINDEELQSAPLAAEIRTVLARTIVRRGERPGRAVTILRQTLDQLGPEAEPGRRIYTLRVLALALDARGKHEEAAAAFAQAAKLVGPDLTPFVGYRLYTDHARVLLRRSHPASAHRLQQLLENAHALAARLDVPACAREVEALKVITAARLTPEAGIVPLQELQLQIERERATNPPLQAWLLTAVGGELERERLQIEGAIQAAFNSDAAALQILVDGLQAENPHSSLQRIVAMARAHTGAERALLVGDRGDGTPALLVKSGFGTRQAEQRIAAIWAAIPESPQLLGDSPSHTAMLFPLRDNAVFRGLLYLDRPLGTPPRPFTPTELKSCSLLANGLGSLIHLQRPTSSPDAERPLFTINRSPRHPARYAPLVTCTTAMLRVLDMVEIVKDTDIPVLILGESGTGKELVARALHDRSRRVAGRFVALNCAAVPRDLLEAELFGHVRGAFTGAQRDRRGLFLEADGGTLFLDEIGEMPADLQAKLLRAIEDQRITPVGATRPLRVDFRVVAATNVEIAAAVSAGRFRADLYYRLNGFQISLPPLRDRLDDIDLLVDHFLSEQSVGDAIFSLTPEARRALRSYDWPGNVRELRNVVQAAAIFAQHDEGLIRTAHLPERIVHQAASAPLAEELLARLYASIEANGYRKIIEDVERYVLTAALERAGGNRRAAARTIALEESSVRTKLRRLGLDVGAAALSPGHRHEL